MNRKNGTSRRNFLRSVAAAGTAGAVPIAAGATRPLGVEPAQFAAGEAESSVAPIAVHAPDLPTLAPRRVNEDGVNKEFHIICEPVKREFVPGRVVDCWGFNGTCPGPTIEVTQGDRVRLVVENRLPEPFSMHWHGFEIPVEMDGVPGVTQDPIEPGGTFVYEFTLHQHGTFFYHSHMAMQELMGMVGMFIMHPRRAYQPTVHRDYGLILQTWQIKPNSSIVATQGMDINWFTINGRAGPATTPLLAKLGERVRLRMVNLSMIHHPIHLHGFTFQTVGTEGGRIPRSAWEPGNTVLVGVAQARDVEFDAEYLGDWMLHCHLPHHMMNQMVPLVGPRHIKGEDANMNVPGYRQDMFMAMDQMVAKPETRGMRPTWSGGVMGMMSIVRVLEPEMFDSIQEEINARDA